MLVDETIAADVKDREAVDPPEKIKIILVKSLAFEDKALLVFVCIKWLSSVPQLKLPEGKDNAVSWERLNSPSNANGAVFNVFSNL